MSPWVVWGVFLVTLILLIVSSRILKTTELGNTISDTIWGLNLKHYSKVFEKVSRSDSKEFEERVLAARENTLPEPPRLSHSSGRYPEGIPVSVSELPGATQRYTLDGSVPRESDREFLDPLMIESNTVLRVKAFHGAYVSETVTEVYFIADYESVLSGNLTIDPVYLFEKHAGIYRNPEQRGRAWERPATLHLSDPAHRSLLREDVRIRIHGGGSRRLPKKNFRVYVDKRDVGFDELLKIPKMERNPPQSVWILRHAGNPNQCWSDRFIRRIASELNIVVGDSVPLVLNLNGKEWGVYELLERVNSRFFERHEGPGKYRILHGGSLRRPNGNNEESKDWSRIYRFIAENDLSEASMYERVGKEIDIASLMDYFALSIFMADIDRPQGNIDMYRLKGGDDSPPGKWKFAYWDFDGGLNYRGLFARHDTFAWHLRESLRPELKPVGRADNESMQSATTLLRSLVRNDQFRLSFRKRFRQLINSSFSNGHLSENFDKLLTDYEEVIPLERKRLDVEGSNASFSYDDRINEIRNFIAERPEFVSRLIDQYLGD